MPPPAGRIQIISRRQSFPASGFPTGTPVGPTAGFFVHAHTLQDCKLPKHNTKENSEVPRLLTIVARTTISRFGSGKMPERRQKRMSECP
jgi:hypothetical protein